MNLNDSVYSEQAVIGGLLELRDMSLKPCQYALSVLKPNSFTYFRFREAFQIIKKLANQGQDIDPLIIESIYLQGHQGETGMLSDLMDAIKNAVKSNLVSHVNLVRDFAVQRTVISRLEYAKQIMSEPDNRPVSEKIGEVDSMLNAIMNRAMDHEESGLIHIKDILESWTDDLQDRLENPQLHEGLGTGLDSLDKVLGVKKMLPGSLVVVGARPKMGKTAFLGWLAKHVSLDLNKAVASFSLEMPNDQMAERLIADRANVNSDIFYTGGNDKEYAKVSQAMCEYIGSNLYIDDTPGIDLDHVKREARKLHKVHKLALIEVDYLTLMKAHKAERNDLAYGAITTGLKQLAKELHCVVVLVTQLNRELEKRPDKRPRPADSRDTGQIEQDCDLWIGLYRDEIYHEDSQYKGTIEILVRSNRHGGTGHTFVCFNHGKISPFEGPMIEPEEEETADDDF